MTPACLRLVARHRGLPRRSTAAGIPVGHSNAWSPDDPDSRQQTPAALEEPRHPRDSVPRESDASCSVDAGVVPLVERRRHGLPSFPPLHSFPTAAAHLPPLPSPPGHAVLPRLPPLPGLPWVLQSPGPPAPSAALSQQRRFSKKGKGKKGGKQSDAEEKSEEGRGEGSAGGQEHGDADQDGPESDVTASIKDLHNCEENTTVLLSKAEIQGFLVEGLPVGLERDFISDTGEAFPIYPLVMRRVLGTFLASLSSSSRANTAAGGSSTGTDDSASPRSKFLLQGPPGSGKSVLLGLACAWARANGWLVLYVPKARDWVRGGLYYKQPEGGRWDTPVQAQLVLQHLLAAHGETLKGFPLHDRRPLVLSQAPEHERTPEELRHELPSEQEAPSFSLGDLAKTGAEERDAAVSALLRMKDEFEKVQGVQVLVAVDEFNQWFTFSTYFEATGDRSRRQIHAKELSMVSAFRSLQNLDSPVITAAAFSESIGVGQLAPRLPGVPKGISFPVPRLSLDESRHVLTNHVQRQLGEDAEDIAEEDIIKAHFLAVGNGAKLKKLSYIL